MNEVLREHESRVNRAVEVCVLVCGTAEVIVATSGGQREIPLDELLFRAHAYGQVLMKTTIDVNEIRDAMPSLAFPFVNAFAIEEKSGKVVVTIRGVPLEQVLSRIHPHGNALIARLSDVRKLLSPIVSPK